MYFKIIKLNNKSGIFTVFFSSFFEYFRPVVYMEIYGMVSVSSYDVIHGFIAP